MAKANMYAAPGISMMVEVGTLPDGVIEFLYLDSEGVPRHNHARRSGVHSIAALMNPRSAWPATGNFDLLEIEREERQAAEARKAKRRAARKAKRSNKLKRRALVPA